MASLRKQIRAAVVTAIKNAATAAGNRVFANRKNPLWETEAPCIAVYTDKESVRVFNESPRQYERKVQLIVSIAVDPAVNVDDQVDDISEEVEAAMAKDETFGGLTAECLLVDTEVEILDEGKELMGYGHLTFEILYYTFAPNTEPVDDFEKGNFEIETTDSGEIDGKFTVPGATP